MIKSTFDSVYKDVPINYTADSYDIELVSTEKCNSIKKGIIKKYQKSSYSKSYSNHNRIIIELIKTSNSCKYIKLDRIRHNHRIL